MDKLDAWIDSLVFEPFAAKVGRQLPRPRASTKTRQKGQKRSRHVQLLWHRFGPHLTKKTIKVNRKHVEHHHLHPHRKIFPKECNN
eukprot:2625302-Amphidinium_carterae.1